MEQIALRHARQHLLNHRLISQSPVTVGSRQGAFCQSPTHADTQLRLAEGHRAAEKA